MADAPKLDAKTDRIVRRQAADLSRYLDLAADDTLEVHTEWRRAARDRMESIFPADDTPDTALWLPLFTRASGATGSFGSAFRPRLTQIIEAAQQAAIDDTNAILAAHGEVLRPTERPDAAIDSFVAQVDALLVNVQQRALTEAAMSGGNWRRITAAVTAQNGALDSVRMSVTERVHALIAQAHSKATVAAIIANDRPDAPLYKRVSEVNDIENHPISRVLDGQYQRPLDPFRASHVAVAWWGRNLRRGIGGIFWPRVGDDYEGQWLPAHRHERGVLHAFRPSWTTKEK